MLIPLGDEIRRLVTETVIPLVAEKIQQHRQNKKLAIQKKTDGSSHGNIEVYPLTKFVDSFFEKT